MILSMSRLAPDKGLEYLIGAASLLPSSIQVKIIIAGDGPSRDSLERLANRLDVMDRVTFAGFREDVLELLAVCDVLALPSLREGLSIALLEAMAAGKPIIATSIGSQREVAAHADMALLVPPLNAVSVSQAIQRMAEDRALMARLGSNARAVYERYYTEDRMLQSYRQLYLDLVEAKCGVAARTNLGPGRFLQHEECWMKECVIDGVQSNNHPEVQP
jgi:glycosyltransferase involved in cell wall biosynthesis